MKTKTKLAELAKLTGQNIKVVKQSIRIGCKISGVTFAMALDAMLEKNRTGLRIDINATPENK